MCKLVFDAGPLITACKFSVANRLVIDHLLDHCEIVVAESVRAEVVIAGANYPDAQAAQVRLDQGHIAALSPPFLPDLEELLALYRLGDGERDTILLSEHIGLQDATLVIDDHLAYLVSDRLRRRQRFLLDVVADLCIAGEMDKQVAGEIVQAVRGRYPPSFVEHTMLLLKR
jgi:hypothetical protein